MKISLAVFALINNVSAELGVWNDAAYCGPGTDIAYIENTMFSLQDCEDWCLTQDSANPNGGNMCCDYEGWTSGLADCTLWGDDNEVIPFQNLGGYGDTEYNYYVSMTFTSGDAASAAAPVLPTPGVECVNDDSTGDSGGTTCSQYYDNNYTGCGNWDTATFSSWNQCCECGGGLDNVVNEDACVNDDSTGDGSGDTCSSWYDAYPSSCGDYDTSDFSAADQCCACDGGADPSTGIVEDAVAELCVNDDSVSDRFGDTCASWYDAYPSGCGSFDDDDFSAASACCVCGGGTFNDLPSNEAGPTPTGCVNNDSIQDRFGDTCSSWYDTYPSTCGYVDEGDFTASNECCACGGGITDGSGSSDSSGTIVGSVCTSDLSTSDSTGDTCTWYDMMGGAACSGTFDDADFSAQSQCCACGGGNH